MRASKQRKKEIFRNKNEGWKDTCGRKGIRMVGEGIPVFIVLSRNLLRYFPANCIFDEPDLFSSYWRVRTAMLLVVCELIKHVFVAIVVLVLMVPNFKF